MKTISLQTKLFNKIFLLSKFSKKVMDDIQ